LEPTVANYNNLARERKAIPRSECKMSGIERHGNVGCDAVDLLINPEDAGDLFLRNNRLSMNFTTLESRKLQSSLQVP
jgi:hypothetical protein